MNIQNNKIKISCILIILISILLKISIISKPFFTQFDEILNLTNYSSYYSSKKDYNIILSGNKNCSDKIVISNKPKIIKIPIINFICKSISLNSNTVINNIFLYSLKMSFNVNYAPINFLFANSFLNRDESFHKKLFQSRIPFLVLSIFSLIFLFRLLENLIDKKEIIFLLISLVSFSHMINSYEVQSIPWGISSLASIILIYFTSYSREEILKIKFIILILFLNIIFFYFNWSLLFLSLSFYLITIYFYKNKKLIISFIVYLISIIPGFLIIFQKVALGARNDFLQIKLNNEIFYNIIERIYFIFVSNFHPINSIFETRIYLIFLFVIFIFSFLFFFSKVFKEENKLITFCIISITIYLMVNIIGKFPFKASRHTIFLYPQFLVILGFGLNYLFQLFDLKKSFKFIIIGLSSFHCLIFFVNYANFVNQYKILQNDKNYYLIKNYIDRNNVNHIFTDRINILWIENIKSNIHADNDIEKKFQSLDNTKQDNLVVLSNYNSNSYYLDIKNKYNLDIIKEIKGKNIDIITDNVYKNYSVSNLPKYENNLIIFKILNEKTVIKNTSN